MKTVLLVSSLVILVGIVGLLVFHPNSPLGSKGEVQPTIGKGEVQPIAPPIEREDQTTLRTTDGKVLIVKKVPTPDEFKTLECIDPDRHGVPELGKYCSTGVWINSRGLDRVKRILSPTVAILETAPLRAGYSATKTLTGRVISSRRWDAEAGMEFYVNGLDTKHMVDGQEFPKMLLIYIGPYRTKDGRTLQGYAVPPFKP